MKLLSLNIWGGRKKQELFEYIKQQSETVDIFFFQEVFNSTSEILNYDKARTHLLTELSELLLDFNSYFAPCYSGWIDRERVNFSVEEGQAVFVKKGLKVLETGSVYTCGNENTIISDSFEDEPKKLQWLILDTGSSNLFLGNVHGIWHPGEKLDTPERLKQSEIIVDCLNKFNCSKILAGDFNLMPDTQSIKIIEDCGLVNLIKKFEIKNTRNKVSWDQYNNQQFFADFTFTSPEIEIKNFEVPYNEVSDHLPMILEF